MHTWSVEHEPTERGDDVAVLVGDRGQSPSLMEAVSAIAMAPRRVTSHVHARRAMARRAGVTARNVATLENDILQH